MPEYSDRIKSILDSDAGKAMKDYLTRETSELNSLENMKSIDDPVAQAIEVKACKKAYLKLKTILSQIMTWEEPEKPKGRKTDKQFYPPF